MQINLELLFNAGIPPIKTVGDPGSHGAGVLGIHGVGVSTPNAAVVAAATDGLAGERHMPKGRIFNIALLSKTFAQGDFE